MNPKPDELEKAIHHVLRDLPQRKAPVSLESRVAAEIARRASLPWWHRSWVCWPAAIRWTFLILSAALCAATILGAIEYLRSDSAASLGRGLAAPVRTVSALWIAVRTTYAAASDLVGLIPRVWLYAGLAGFGVLYAMLFTIGATAYRTLWQTR